MEVSDSSLTGYMWGENIGWINLSCTNPPETCGTVSYGVTNDGAGNLGGYAWGENVGWISFSCQNNPSTCAGTGNYGVSIDAPTGVFSGFAYGENIGWIGFNCAKTASCATVGYKVETSWRGPTPGAVGGIAELPDVDATPLEATDSSGPSTGLLAGIAAVGVAAAATLSGAAWYARRRWLT